jgi:hypothetical protein
MMSYRVIDYSPSSVTLKIEDEQQEFYFSVPREFLVLKFKNKCILLRLRDLNVGG